MSDESFGICRNRVSMFPPGLFELNYNYKYHHSSSRSAMLHEYHFQFKLKKKARPPHRKTVLYFRILAMVEVVLSKQEYHRNSHAFGHLHDIN